MCGVVWFGLMMDVIKQSHILLWPHTVVWCGHWLNFIYILYFYYVKNFISAQRIIKNQIIWKIEARLRV